MLNQILERCANFLKNQEDVWLLMGHQPVLNFHTGLAAKAWLVSAISRDPSLRNRVLVFFHDLDPEAGMWRFSVPFPRGDRGSVWIVDNLPSRKERQEKLPTFGPVITREKDEIVKNLFQMLQTISDGTLPRPILEETRWRIEHFADKFASKTFPSLADLNVKVIKYSFSLVTGKVFPPSLWLSDLLWGVPKQSTGINKLQEAFHNSLEELVKSGPKIWSKPPFWEWRPVHQRFPVNWGECQKLLKERRLIPNRDALALAFHRAGALMVGGTGQRDYEKLLKARGILLPTPTVTVTSTQIVPPIWQGRFPLDFRPPLLLLYVLGGQLDPRDFHIEYHDWKEERG